MNGQITQPINGLASVRSKISLTQYNRMVDEVNGQQTLATGGAGTAYSLRAGHLRVHGTRSSTAASFPWSMIQFGYTSLSGGKVKINSGNIIKRTYAAVSVAETTVTLLDGTCWVGIEMDRALTLASIIVQAYASFPRTDDATVRFWFYMYTNKVLTRINLGQLMDVDITAYGD